MDSGPVRGIDRRRLIGWGGLATAGVVAAGVPLVSARIGHADSAPTGSSGHDRIPPDALSGGAYDRYVAQLAAEGKFYGVVLLSHQGRTVLSRSYGMAYKEKGIRNHEGIAFSLSSAGKPFHAVAILQLAQRGKLQLTDRAAGGGADRPDRAFRAAPSRASAGRPDRGPVARRRRQPAAAGVPDDDAGHCVYRGRMEIRIRHRNGPPASMGA